MPSATVLSPPPPATNTTASIPEWGRVPPPGQIEPHTGFRRAFIYEGIRAGWIRSVVIRKPGAIRGVRIIHLPSLLAHLRELADEQNKPKPN